jgi:glycosyltransferase involved in cell wall biosynthesis
MHTFVIPVYKQSQYLEQCIQSLLNQTVKSTIILTTSTPTDFSKQIAEKYNFPYFVNDNGGIANDWNFALSKALTPWATIAHQDDIYEPDFTDELLRAANSDTLIAFTDYEDLVNGEPRKSNLNSFVKKVLLFPFALKKTIKSTPLKKSVLIFGDPICCPSVSFNLDALGGFRFSKEFTVALDWYAWYEIAAKKGAFCFINKKLIKHRIHAESETTLKLSEGKRRQEELQMFNIIWGNKIARVFSWIYTLGYADNKLKADL